jgi:hypothetical protein
MGEVGCFPDRHPAREQAVGRRSEDWKRLEEAASARQRDADVGAVRIPTSHLSVAPERSADDEHPVDFLHRRLAPQYEK